MVLNLSKQAIENKNDVQGETNISQTNRLCAACGESNPEYVLDNRKLCFDCYKAEKYYWAKACAPY